MIMAKEGGEGASIRDDFGRDDPSVWYPTRDGARFPVLLVPYTVFPFPFSLTHILPSSVAMTSGSNWWTTPLEFPLNLAGIER
ncbi:hypothetical protein F9C07_7302 [Aspergillus flavus]|uniref:Uncharacterized protein n=1 Tax=Aspergillus flavus (strain ATCC 200026 / FGSC A1120 / IAM 13836 / NRRL 3357 / JCM 12722 / SRRC 167) TaxID=332952 RepID=A0A7U2QXH3_ASPFN|nr:hypothetical protein F9C07_7302 [Aspergillus flavus]